MAGNKISTNRKNYFSWYRSKVDIIKLSHYFFNKDSALFFPVKLPDSSEKAKIDQAALDIIGIKSLATVFKHCQEDGRLRVVISGHSDADEGGDVPGRFVLSGLRAKAVYALLAGKKDDWAKAVFEKHSVLDFKLILKYIHLNKGVYFGTAKDQIGVLDPGDIDDKWNDKADKATRNFIIGFNKYAKIRKVESLKLSVVIKKVKDDASNRWPEEMWKAVYILYENAVSRTLGLKKKTELASKRKNILKFCDDKKPFVSCGESVPLKTLKDKPKSNYEPEPGRGVEIIFFNRKALPGKIVSKKMRIICPAVTDAAHTAVQCPIFYKYHLKTTYIDHRNLDLVLYHIKFVYYDRIKNDIVPVPAGLKIDMAYWNSVTNTKVPIDAVTDYNDGVYTVKIPDDKNRTNLSMWFGSVDAADATKKYWIFTEATGSDPILVLKTDVEIAALTPADRLKYHDLPKKWCSLNYWARFGKYSTGDTYQKIMKQKKFKPYGTKMPDSSKPMIFSLDDIVLTGNTGRQGLRDKKKDNVSVVNLSKYSRIALLYPDAANGFEIKLDKPMAKEAYFTDIKGGFKKNLIYDSLHDASDTLHRPCRVAVFCGEFYDIYDRRTEWYADFRFNKGHIMGARAARLNDTACSGKKSFSGWDAGDKTSAYVCDEAGNYRLQYHHDWGIHDGKVQSGLILYWNCRFTVDGGRGGVAQDKKNYIEQGMKHAMDRIGLKKYSYEMLSGPKDIVIRTFPLFEAKQDYKVGGSTYKRGGAHMCMVSLVDDTNTSSMGFNTATLRHSSYRDEPDRFVVNDPNNAVADYDGNTFNPTTGAHEIGHALGLDDEYARTADSLVGLPQYVQYYPGVPYSGDMLTLMNKNRGTRMHHFWLYANWINDAGGIGGALESMLDSTKFKMTLRGAGFDDLIFDLTGNDYRNIYDPVYDDDCTYSAGVLGRLIVYKLGDGEFANTLKSGQKFTGIMVVRPNIHVTFANDTANWAVNEMVDWVQALDSDLKIMLGKKYWLKANTVDHVFKKVYMYVLPHYKGGGAAPAGTNFTINVKKNGNSGFTPDALNKSKIEVDDNVDNKKLIRHFFGQFAGVTDLTKAELDPIKDWIGHATRANDTFTIEDL
ncbi:MAG: hypothetical protein KAV42_09345 [Candidatus Krumholzibacteria bacterium]|nr:hypothetical protein [Candidatus Krumholzibacteria bacterium]